MVEVVAMEVDLVAAMEAVDTEVDLAVVIGAVLVLDTEAVLVVVMEVPTGVDTEVVSEEVMLEDTATMAMVWGWV
jgi:hypothetical protein